LCPCCGLVRACRLLLSGRTVIHKLFGLLVRCVLVSWFLLLWGLDVTGW
jgi:hypothetical protein